MMASDYLRAWHELQCIRVTLTANEDGSYTVTSRGGYQQTVSSTDDAIRTGYQVQHFASEAA